MSEKNLEQNIENEEQQCSENVDTQTSEMDKQPSELERLQNELKELKESLLRTIADSENLRKRLEKEKLDSVKFAVTSLASELLSVADNFERVSSLSGQEVSVESVVTGVGLCEKELHSILEKYGVKKIACNVGDKFDHQYHQAMSEIVDDELDPGTIKLIMQNGYMLHDRLLRPVMVSVTKKS